jgi:hypothetical protein
LPAATARSCNSPTSQPPCPLSCSGGQVIDKLHELGLQYSEQQAAAIFAQAAAGVAHLHEYNVLHRWALVCCFFIFLTTGGSA